MGQQGFEIGGRDHGRRAAAEMDVAHREVAWQGRGDQVDLAIEQVEIFGDRIVARDDLGVAAAVPAHGPAERHMEIERQALAGGQVAQPFQIVRRLDLRAEMGCRREAGVARHPEAVILGDEICVHGGKTARRKPCPP